MYFYLISLFAMLHNPARELLSLDIPWSMIHIDLQEEGQSFKHPRNDVV